MAVERDTVARAIGRYVLFREVAHGGMATVHLGRLRGPAGFSRTVAIKRLHPQFARDPEFVSMFLDEARLAARIQHPNVVGVLDVVAAEGELFLVMDYVHGESFAKLLAAAREKKVALSPRIATAIAVSVLDGLHAAHEARNERGDPLGIVHRDVSPQNVMVGADGVARVLDFGIAKASQHAHATTREGQMKGKVPYMAPEQVAGGTIDRRTDVYSASVMLWESLTGKRLFPQADVITTAQLVVSRDHPPPSSVNDAVPKELDAVVLKGLARDPDERWKTAHEMAAALERAWPMGSSREVGEWVRRVAEEPLGARAQSIAEIENAQLPAARTSDHPRSGRISLVGRSASMPSITTDATPLLTREPASSKEAPAGVPRSRRTLLIAAAAAGAAVVAAVALVIAVASPSGPGAAAPSASAEVSSVPATSATPLPSSAPADQPATSATATATATIEAGATAAGSATQRSRPLPLPARPAGGSRRGCNPPYTVDANGVRIPKRQCF
jgi:serine/threonine-protein kinase